MNTEQLQALSDRLEGLSGADRVADREIGLLLAGWMVVDHEDFGEALDVDGDIYPDSPGSEYPTFTDSLDAVVELVERVLPGWWWEVARGTISATSGPFWGYVYGKGEINCPHGDPTPFGGATPAIALLRALVAAKIEEAAISTTSGVE